MSNQYAEALDGLSGGSGGGGITSINGDSTAAQLISAGSGIGVSTTGGNTTVSALVPQCARAQASVQTGITSQTTILFTTLSYDNSSSFTGYHTNGGFVCPVAGKYLVNVSILLSGSWVAANELDLLILKNTTVISDFVNKAAGTIAFLGVRGSDILDCLANDVIYMATSSSLSTAVVNQANATFMSICRVSF